MIWLTQKMFCSSTPTTGVLSPVSFVEVGGVRLLRRHDPQLALKLDVIGDRPAAFPQLVGERDGGGQPPFELVA